MLEEMELRAERIKKKLETGEDLNGIKSRKNKRKARKRRRFK